MFRLLLFTCLTATGTEICSSRIFWDTQRLATRDGTRGLAKGSPLLPISTPRLIRIVFAETPMTTTGPVKEWMKFVIAEMYRAEEYTQSNISWRELRGLLMNRRRRFIQVHEVGMP